MTTLSTNTPSYAKILEVDQQIRDFFGVARDSTAESERTSAAMRVFVRSHYEDLSAYLAITIRSHRLINQ